MSWQAYVDTNLVGTGKIAMACIIGHDGNTWATSKGFTVRLSAARRFHVSHLRAWLQVSPAEGKKLAGAFNDPSDIIANGIHAGGVKYLALRYNDRSVYGKKVRFSSSFFRGRRRLTLLCSRALVVSSSSSRSRPSWSASTARTRSPVRPPRSSRSSLTTSSRSAIRALD